MIRLAHIVGYSFRQFHLARQGKAYPIAKLHNLAWFDSRSKRLPTVTLDSVFPGIRETQIQLQSVVPRDPGGLTADELCVVAMITQFLAPAAIFEFGTFTGRTTLAMAMNSPPDTRIYTLDLEDPGSSYLRKEKRDEVYHLGAQSGSLHRSSDYSGKIEQLWGDSARFNEEQFLESIDLIFIDASHSYEYVMNDTRKALKMARNGGVILWHDYCVFWPGVTRYLHELARSYPICHIEGTHLAVLPLTRVQLH